MTDYIRRDGIERHEPRRSLGYEILESLSLEKFSVSPAQNHDTYHFIGFKSIAFFNKLHVHLIQ